MADSTVYKSWFPATSTTGYFEIKDLIVLLYTSQSFLHNEPTFIKWLLSSKLSAMSPVDIIKSGSYLINDFRNIKEPFFLRRKPWFVLVWVSVKWSIIFGIYLELKLLFIVFDLNIFGGWYWGIKKNNITKNIINKNNPYCEIRKGIFFRFIRSLKIR